MGSPTTPTGAHLPNPALPVAATQEPAANSGAEAAVASAWTSREVSSRTMASLVLELVRPYRRWLALVLAAMLVETAMSLAAPWPLKVVIDNVLGAHPLPDGLGWIADTAPGRSKAGLAVIAAAALVAIAAVGALATYVENYYTESVGQWVAHDLRVRIYDHLQRLSLAYYDRQQSGVLLSTITNDVGTVQDFASSDTLDILVDLLTIVGILWLMFWLNWDFALVAVGVVPFLLLFVMRFKKAVKRATHEVRLRQADIVTVVQQGLESVRVVKAYGRQDLEEQRLGEASQATIAAALKARRIKSLLSPVVSVIVAGCTAFVLWRGASLIVAGAMTVGALTVFLAYLTKFFKPVQDLAKMTNTIAQAAVALERIQGILDTDKVIVDRPHARQLDSVRGEIVFEHVAFGYDPAAPVLRDVSFRIEPGQLVGVVGTTGGGKSTVVSLIPRFYDADCGRVLIDGSDVKDVTKASLRGQIGFVLQDTVLFRGSIRDNIAYGRPGATESEIAAAARLANAHEFISAMPHRYDTLVGERGLTLSGGQRQRIGIARAIIRNSPILILDEPTAALDSESERLVIEGLERLMKGRTVITIAHRLSTIRDAHKIIVLKDGVVAEQGTHDELLKLAGVYAELHRVQFEQAPAAAAPAASRLH
ncbi:MAG TPA: ABC transporter ATP-binding protein [Casimicrobiaceae bacterium]|nr:ABC transporter ATP-binding protein [Casimicrobiaceae bacterium]